MVIMDFSAFACVYGEYEIGEFLGVIWRQNRSLLTAVISSDKVELTEPYRV